MSDGCSKSHLEMVQVGSFPFGFRRISVYAVVMENSTCL